MQGDASGGADAHLAGEESAEVVGGLGDDGDEPPLQLAADGDIHEAAGFPLRQSFSGRQRGRTAGAEVVELLGMVVAEGVGTKKTTEPTRCFLIRSTCLFNSFLAGSGC